MMFSSRRSRNRHSANPNPKLHLPQTVRRKLPDGDGALGLADSATGEFEDEDGEDASGGAYPGSPMSLSSQYALQCAAAAAGSAVQAQIVLDDDDDDDDDDDAASNRSTAVQSTSTLPEDNFAPFSAAAATEPSTPSSETALNLVCSPRASSAVARETAASAADPDQGVPTAQVGGTVRGTSKRKSAVPTRCSTQQIQDDELISDDNSSDEPAAKRRGVELAPPTPALEGSTSSADQTTEKSSGAVEPNNNNKLQAAENGDNMAGQLQEQVSTKLEMHGSA